MILAAPLVIPFAEAVGISIATLGMAKAADMVNDYIQENPEQSIKILSTIVPGVGIGEIFMKKGKDEEVEEEVEVEDVDARDLTRAEKAKMMKELAKSGGGNMREKMKKGYEEIIQPGESDRELDDAEDRYDGGVEDAPKPKFDYKKFFKNRYADGGAIGIEVLFENKNPRQGLFMGGSPLEGQALSIYNSMNAYGFDDQAIANALQEQGLYTPGGSTPDPTPDPTPDTGQTIGYQGGSDNFSPYNPDPNSIKPFKPMGANFQNQKPNAFSTGIAKMIDNPIIKTLGFAMNPPLGFAKAILSKAGSMMPVNERSIFENLAGNTGVRVNDIGQIVNTGKYNTPEGVMAGYNLNKVTDKTFDKRTDRIEKTLSEKYGLTAEEIEDVKAGTYTGKKGFNTTMGTTTNLFSQLRNILSAKNTIMSQKNIAAQMAKQQREAKAAADALAIQQSGLTDLGNIQKIQQYTGQPLSDYRMSRPASERNYTGGSTNSNPSTPGAQDSFSNKSGMGRTGYSEGGLATMFKEKR